MYLDNLDDIVYLDNMVVYLDNMMKKDNKTTRNKAKGKKATTTTTTNKGEIPGRTYGRDSDNLYAAPSWS